MIIHSGNDCQIRDPFVALAKKDVVVLIFGILHDKENGLLVKANGMAFMELKGNSSSSIRDLKQTLEAVRWTSTGSKISRSRAN